MRIGLLIEAVLITSTLVFQTLREWQFCTCNCAGTWLIKFEKHGSPIQDPLGLSLFFICKMISCHSSELTPHICIPLKVIKALVSSTVPAILSTIESVDWTMSAFFCCSFMIQSMLFVCAQIVSRLFVVAYHVLVLCSCANLHNWFETTSGGGLAWCKSNVHQLWLHIPCGRLNVHRIDWMCIQCRFVDKYGQAFKWNMMWWLKVLNQINMSDMQGVCEHQSTCMSKNTQMYPAPYCIWQLIAKSAVRRATDILYGRAKCLQRRMNLLGSG